MPVPEKWSKYADFFKEETVDGRVQRVKSNFHIVSKEILMDVIPPKYIQILPRYLALLDLRSEELESPDFAEKLRRAYQKAALKFHPDKNSGDLYALILFQELQAIKELLETAHNPTKIANLLRVSSPEVSPPAGAGHGVGIAESPKAHNIFAARFMQSIDEMFSDYKRQWSAKLTMNPSYFSQYQKARLNAYERWHEQIERGDLHALASALNLFYSSKIEKIYVLHELKLTPLVQMGLDALRTPSIDLQFVVSASTGQLRLYPIKEGNVYREISPFELPNDLLKILATGILVYPKVIESEREAPCRLVDSMNTPGAINIVIDKHQISLKSLLQEKLKEKLQSVTELKDDIFKLVNSSSSFRPGKK